MDSLGFDFNSAPLSGRTLDAIAAACNADPNCKGFTIFQRGGDTDATVSVGSRALSLPVQARPSEGDELHELLHGLVDVAARSTW